MAVTGRIQPTVRRVASIASSVVTAPNRMSIALGVAARRTNWSKSTIGQARTSTETAASVQSTAATRPRQAGMDG